MRNVIFFIVAALIANLFNACSDNQESAVEERTVDMHFNFLSRELIAAKITMDKLAAENYQYLEDRVVDSSVSVAQFDSLRKFKQNMRRYRQALDMIRYVEVSETEGITYNEADTLHYNLVDGSKSSSVQMDTLQWIQQLSDSLIIWYSQVPYCKDTTGWELTFDFVGDYGRSGSTYAWTAAAMQDVNMQELLLSISILQLRSLQLEVRATNRVIREVARSKN